MTMKNIPNQTRPPNKPIHPAKVDNFKKIISEISSTRDKEVMQKVLGICLLMKKHKGRPVLIGGFARDLMFKKLGLRSEVDFKDIDIEIYDMAPEILEKALSHDKETELNLVGKSFGVYKMGPEIDISLPRKDSKTGIGHTGFKTSFSPKMSLKEASSRRDFTCNAIAVDPFTGEIIDEHGWVNDILEKKLRCVDKSKFAEDPLRVLRAMRFASVLEFEIEEKTKELCKKIDLSELSNSRIGEE